MASTSYLGGKAELAFGTQTIEPEFLGTMTVTLEEGVRTTTSLGGVISKPSGVYETAEITGEFILPSIDALNKLYSHIYQGGTYGGRTTFGGNNCTEQEPKTVNIHYTCESDSRNDFHADKGIIKSDFTVSYDADGNLTVPFTIILQPNDDGEYGFAGAGSLTSSVIWDATTQNWVASGVSA